MVVVDRAAVVGRLLKACWIRLLLVVLVAVPAVVAEEVASKAVD